MRIFTSALFILIFSILGCSNPDNERLAYIPGRGVINIDYEDTWNSLTEEEQDAAMGVSTSESSMESYFEEDAVERRKWEKLGVPLAITKAELSQTEVREIFKRAHDLELLWRSDYDDYEKPYSVDIVYIYAKLAKHDSLLTSRLVSFLDTAVSQPTFDHYPIWSLEEAVETSGRIEQLRPVLKQAYSKRYDDLLSAGFDPSTRYDNEYYLTDTSGKDPFYCSDIKVLIRELLKLGELLERPDALLLWKTHLADTYMTPHHCDGGSWSPASALAYSLYGEIEEMTKAQSAARAEAEKLMRWYKEGRCLMCHPNKQTRIEEDLDSALVWFDRSNISDIERRDLLTNAAEYAESKQQLRSALRLYRIAGDSLKVYELSLLTSKAGT